MNDRSSAPRVAAIVAASAAWFGVLLQLYLSLRLSVANGKTIGEGLVVYLGYFTILTNILVAVTLTVPSVAPATSGGRFFKRPGVRTATAATIALVGLAYHLLLRNVWQPRGLQLVADLVLHYATPILFLLFWWVAVPKDALRWQHIGAWLSFPAGYFIYMLIRGELTGLYPYHFIDVGALGYGRTLANALFVLVGFVGIALLLLVVGRLRKTSVADPG
jgi:hypothetical protein